MDMRFRNPAMQVALVFLLMANFGGLRVDGYLGTPKQQSLQESGQASAGSSEQPRSARDLVVLVQEALRARDKARILAVTRFPVRVGEKEDERADLDESAFVRDYEKVWNAQTVKAVLDEDPDHVVWSPGALTEPIGCGEVWFRKLKDGTFRITEFNISEYTAAGFSIQDCYRVRDFVTQLQKNVAADDRTQVIAALKYPLRYHGQHQNVTIRDEAEMRRRYDVVFSSALRRAIAKQKVWHLGVQNDGVAIEHGFIWINKTSENGPFKVISIFEPYL